MKVRYPQTSTAICGFDSAWTNKNRGAICAITFDSAGQADFRCPQPVSFDQAAAYIGGLQRDFALTLVAVDQPTIVPNAVGSRPVDRKAAALVSYIGGGVQPANRGKLRMFCDASPIWNFLLSTGCVQAPMAARLASEGHFLIEVFPALALASLNDEFSVRLGGPKYNPANRRKFRLNDWARVARTTARIATDLGVHDLALWAEDAASIAKPVKADQDRLDAAICALIGLIWRSAPEESSAMLGDLETGYIVTPVSAATRVRLKLEALGKSLAYSQSV